VQRKHSGKCCENGLIKKRKHRFKANTRAENIISSQVILQFIVHSA
jgi:hypothetical protein